MELTGLCPIWNEIVSGILAKDGGALQSIHLDSEIFRKETKTYGNDTC